MDPDDEENEFYAVLNVSNDASSEEIRKSYRKLAQSLHPDKNQDAKLNESAKI